MTAARAMPEIGTSLDVAAELRLQGVSARALDDHAIAVAGSALGDLVLWTRRDPAHFTDPLGYPRPMVPVVDCDLWADAHPKPRVLLVASARVRTVIVCPVRTTAETWQRRATEGERGYMPAWTCPRDQMQTLGWLRRFLLGGRG